MTREPPRPVIRTVAVVGAGRLGRAMTRALGEAGLHVSGPMMRDERVPAADVVLLCVPDAEIEHVARTGMPGARFVGHTSGATGIGDVDFGLHPLRSFVGDEGRDDFRGIGCAIAGRTPEALEVARALAAALGAAAFPIDDAARPAYHAAASIASNFLVTLQEAAERVAGAAGLAPADARALLGPLVRATVENWEARGPQAALTGPVARGDALTVDRQRAAIAAAAPELIPLFDVLVERTRALAERKENPS